MVLCTFDTKFDFILHLTCEVEELTLQRHAICKLIHIWLHSNRHCRIPEQNKLILLRDLMRLSFTFYFLKHLLPSQHVLQNLDFIMQIFQACPSHFSLCITILWWFNQFQKDIFLVQKIYTGFLKLVWNWNIVVNHYLFCDNLKRIGLLVITST